MYLISKFFPTDHTQGEVLLQEKWMLPQEIGGDQEISVVDEDHCYTAQQCLLLKNREHLLLKLALKKSEDELEKLKKIVGDK